jgi:hypothetical protein
VDESQLLEYLRQHGFALVGKEDTLKSAEALAGRGIVVRLDEDDPVTGNPIYRLSAQGIAMMSKGQKKSLLKSAWHALQDYSDAMQRGNQSGGSDLGNVAGMRFGEDPEWDVTRLGEKKVPKNEDQ